MKNCTISRRWLVTVPNKKEILFPALDRLKEVESLSRVLKQEHIDDVHLFIFFSSSIRIQKIRDIFPGASIDVLQADEMAVMRYLVREG